jgi:hypothetical protein
LYFEDSTFALPFFDFSVGYRNLTLELQRGTWPYLNSSAQWWSVKEECQKGDPLSGLPFSPDCVTAPYSDFLRIFIFNDKVFPSSLTWLSAGG